MSQLILVLGLKGGCTGSSGSINVKIPHCWISQSGAHFSLIHFLLLENTDSMFVKPG